MLYAAPIYPAVEMAVSERPKDALGTHREAQFLAPAAVAEGDAAPGKTLGFDWVSECLLLTDKESSRAAEVVVVCGLVAAAVAALRTDAAAPVAAAFLLVAAAHVAVCAQAHISVAAGGAGRETPSISRVVLAVVAAADVGTAAAAVGNCDAVGFLVLVLAARSFDVGVLPAASLLSSPALC